MRQQVNLYQPIFRKEKKIFSARAMLELCGVILGLLLLYYGVSAWNLSRLENGVALKKHNLVEQRNNLERLKKKFPQKARDRKLESEAAALTRELASKQKILAALSGGGIHGDYRGFSRFLYGLALNHMQGVWLEEIRIDSSNGQLEIRGNAVSPDLVPRYVQGLAGDHEIRGRKFAVFQLARNEDRDSHVYFVMSSKAGAK